MSIVIDCGRALGKDDDGSEVVAIIDTTGTIKGFEPNQIGVFLKKRELVVKNQEQTRTIELSKFPDTTIGPDIVRDWIKQAMRKAPFYIGGFLGIWYLFAKVMQALLLVLFALIGARSMRFGQLFTVAVYALTPAVILDSTLPFTKLHIPLFWAIYWGLGITYAILGAKRADAPPPPPPANAAVL